jgi:hypothetical protein
MKDMLKRREVSLARKTSISGAKGKGKKQAEGTNEIGRKRKRKSASPQSESYFLISLVPSTLFEVQGLIDPLSLLRKELSASSRPTETLTLVPDTPAKPSSKSASFKKPFSRAISLPSFAALGAAVRPGAPDPSSIPLPFGIPPPPVLPGDRQDDMDWEMIASRGGVPGSDDEDDWLISRKEDFRAKGGRSRNTSGSTTEGDEADELESAATASTPKKTRVVLVADTPG